MANPVFAYMCEYEVKDEHQDAFEHAYGPDGEWVRFFNSSNAYLSTELHRDIAKPNRFITVDFWINKAARDGFQKRNKSEFHKIDKACAAFTVSEKLIGEFECFYKG